MGNANAQHQGGEGGAALGTHTRPYNDTKKPAAARKSPAAKKPVAKGDVARHGPRRPTEVRAYRAPAPPPLTTRTKTSSTSRVLKSAAFKKCRQVAARRLAWVSFAHDGCRGLGVPRELRCKRDRHI